jgi:hypothetical protein
MRSHTTKKERSQPGPRSGPFLSPPTAIDTDTEHRTSTRPGTQISARKLLEFGARTRTRGRTDGRSWTTDHIQYVCTSIQNAIRAFFFFFFLHLFCLFKKNIYIEFVTSTVAKRMPLEQRKRKRSTVTSPAMHDAVLRLSYTATSNSSASIVRSPDTG